MLELYSRLYRWGMIPQNTIILCVTSLNSAVTNYDVLEILLNAKNLSLSYIWWVLCLLVLPVH
jgi:hypothetical protein